MMEGDSANLAIEPPDSKYLNGFLDNVGAIQDHLAGNDGTPLSPSFLPPNAVWTPREKNAFFHALSIYSRFRPDLISHVIKTKSVTDVCNYLSVLQLAASQQDTSVSDSQWRQNFPIAMEVSPEWVAIEEETSFDLIAREQDWQCELISERRRTGLKLLKKAYKTESHEVEPSRYKAELKQEIANANLRDRRKDFCDSLGSSELTAIGIILHKSADPSGSSQIIQVPSALHPLAPQDSPGPTAGPGTLQAHQPSATKGTPDILSASTAIHRCPCPQTQSLKHGILRTSLSSGQAVMESPFTLVHLSKTRRHPWRGYPRLHVVVIRNGCTCAANAPQRQGLQRLTTVSNV